MHKKGRMTMGCHPAFFYMIDALFKPKDSPLDKGDSLAGCMRYP